ncbi:MAG TPA: deoxyribodipyrimidine photo-lyase [Opitutaceae bacterium]|nr:deoxyribodipyrimidine photo-lyase [Opitutaceae bacterium]
MLPTTLVWFRIDLRLADNPALDAAVKAGGVVVPVFIWTPGDEEPWQPGGASRWWLHQSLAALQSRLGAAGSPLVIRRGEAPAELRRLAKETGATRVFWNRRYEPACIARDSRIKEVLGAEGIEVRSFNAALLHEPWTIKNQSGRPFQVFTPFWRHCLTKADPGDPLPAPKQLVSLARAPTSLPLADLGLEPRLDWAADFRAVWQPGEAGAAAAWKRFLAGAFDGYAEGRNRPDLIGTARLSPHLHFGEIGPRQVWHGLNALAVKHGLAAARWRDSQFLAEIGWREFAHHLLYHFPHTPAEPLRPDFRRFPWRRNAAWLRAWQKGMTGYPIVDAGMRELWKTGWMHNRVRMIVASFLVKDLLISWEAGARWFWDTLVDADLANNTLGWQWTAGCSADAAPYFRVFNPTAQGEKFDPNGDYVRRWCPELARLPVKWIHQPQNAPAEVRRAADVTLGGNYPAPLVNHVIAREVALEAFAHIKAKPTA